MIESPTLAYIGLGGNLGEVEVTLAEALWQIDALPQTSIRKQSKFYRTPPWGNTDQPEFLNAVVEVQTRMQPDVLLQRLLAIEQNFGRVRDGEERWAPRSLDLDLLMFGDSLISQPGLQVPHPRIAERAFVLVPWAEIAPRCVVPGLGIVQDLLAVLDQSGIHPID